MRLRGYNITSAKSEYFQKTFLIANIKVKIVLIIFFLQFNNINILFSDKTLT